MRVGGRLKSSVAAAPAAPANDVVAMAMVVAEERCSDDAVGLAFNRTSTRSGRQHSSVNLYCTIGTVRLNSSAAVRCARRASRYARTAARAA